MEIHETGRDGSMLEEVGGEKLRKKSWTSQRSRAKRKAYRGRGSAFEWKRVRRSKKNTGYENGEKTAGQ